jgi:hypothetical protein
VFRSQLGQHYSTGMSGKVFMLTSCSRNTSGRPCIHRGIMASSTHFHAGLKKGSHHVLMYILQGTFTSWNVCVTWYYIGSPICSHWNHSRLTSILRKVPQKSSCVHRRLLAGSSHGSMGILRVSHHVQLVHWLTTYSHAAPVGSHHVHMGLKTHMVSRQAYIIFPRGSNRLTSWYARWCPDTLTSYSHVASYRLPSCSHRAPDKLTSCSNVAPDMLTLCAHSASDRLSSCSHWGLDKLTSCSGMAPFRLTSWQHGAPSCSHSTPEKLRQFHTWIQIGSYHDQMRLKIGSHHVQTCFS